MFESEAVATPNELLLKKLNESPTPLLLKDIAKALTQKGKNAPPPPDFTAILSDEAQTGRVFRHPSGKDGAERYWIRDEKLVIREAVLSAVTEPKKLNDLKKLAKEAVKADKKFSDGVVDEMVSAELLHKQGSSSSAAYGKEKPKSLDKAFVTSAILAAGNTPQKAADLVKAAKHASGADKPLIESILKELLESKQLHPQSTAKTPLYGREPPKPPDPLEMGAAKKAFAALVKSAQKVLEAASQVTLDEVLRRLKKALEQLPAVPEMDSVPAPGTSHSGSTPVLPAPKPTHTLVSPHPELKPEPSTSERIRIGLKAAYDELCLDVEFQDKVVEIRRLYHETLKNLPGLGVEQFHRELKHLQHSRIVELQALNEVQKAKEPELSISDGDRLLYFVIWR